MPLLSDYARRKKVDFFFSDVPAGSSILEVGCGAGWLGKTLRARGYGGYRGIDLRPPADIVGDIRDWRALGLAPASFDIIAAFEVIEHVPCVDVFHALLKPGGLLMLTSPAPRWDWACRLLEYAGLSQARTSPHEYLVDFRTLPLFMPVRVRRVALMAQWGIFRKAPGEDIQ